jgi:hypothetical protein
MVPATALLLASLWTGGKSLPAPDSTMPSADSLRRHVEFLAGLPQPRHFANPTAQRMAYTYIEARFRALGLRTALQKFRVAGH